MAQDQGRTLQVGDDVRHREGLAGSRYTEQADVPYVVAEGLCNLAYGLGLVAGRLILRIQMEFHTAKILTLRI